MTFISPQFPVTDPFLILYRIRLTYIPNAAKYWMDVKEEKVLIGQSGHATADMQQQGWGASPLPWPATLLSLLSRPGICQPSSSLHVLCRADILNVPRPSLAGNLGWIVLLSACLL